ncbi:MAG: hypothetical protein ABMB14_17655 [Myxococcota bacterium]
MTRPLLALLSLAACTPAPVDPTTPPDPTDTDPPASTTPPVDTGTPPTTPPVVCEPPERLVLAEIPDAPSLAAVGGETLAAFEVDGDALIGKFVRDPAVAAGALTLWQELVLRIPANQRTQLVQFDVFAAGSDLAAYVDNTGTNNQTGRYGTSLHLSETNIADNDPDVCAPLSGHRGTYDWTLIHEFGHLRQYADGAVNTFVERFGNETGDGEGYPEDGSPVLDGDWVTSYAERAGGDEDAAESFTTFVMLDPTPVDVSLAADKVRFFADQPGYAELRLALRVTEPGGGAAEVPAAPTREFPFDVENPSWMWGTWQGDGPEGLVEYVIEKDDLVFRATIDGAPVEIDYATIRDDGTLATLVVVESSDKFHFHQVAIAADSFSETFVPDGDGIEVDREHFGVVSLSRVAAP